MLSRFSLINKGISPLVKNIFFGLGLLFLSGLNAQYIGGDFMASEEVIKESDQVKIILEEIEKKFTIHAITGYKNRQIKCLEEKSTREKTLQVAKVLKKILLYLPDGYKIMIVGHANKTGREYSERGSVGNDHYSTMRAKSVYDYMITKIPDASQSILIGGFGSHRDQRMVTFKILPSQKALKIHQKLLKKHKW